MKTSTYLDHMSSTPVDERVLEAMWPLFRERFGNASSHHPHGWRAARAVEKARAQVAALLGAVPEELVFTSGATEAINLALRGAMQRYSSRGAHLITSQAEHRAVLDTCRALERRGCEVTYLSPDRTGRIPASEVAAAIRPDTVLVSLMWANNEVGTLNPVREIGEVCRERGVLHFTDASQAVGKVPVDVQADGVDLLALSSHKLYGPPGVGALYVRRQNPRVHLEAQVTGGGHERGMRSGTLNVPGIVGLGTACEILGREFEAEGRRLAGLRDHLEQRLTSELEGVRRNGHPSERLPGCSNLSFARVESESLLLALEGIAVSSGSACASASLEPSHVLRAMGLGDDRAHGALRFGLGRDTTAEEVDHVADRVVETVQSLRSPAPPERDVELPTHAQARVPEAHAFEPGAHGLG